MSDGSCRLEFLVEPFTEGAPGRHVQAAIDAVEGHGLAVDVDAFGNIVEGPLDELAPSLADLVSAAMRSGARRITINVTCPRR